MSPPEPSALQWSSLIPLPRKTTANRLGKADGDGVSAKAFRDSSHGSATAQPAPRRTVRRENRGLELLLESGIKLSPGLGYFGRFAFRGNARVQELRAGDDRFDERTEMIVAIAKTAFHLFDDGLIRQLQGTVE